MTKKKEELGLSTEVKKIDLAQNFLPSQDELNIMTAIVKAVTAGTRNPAGAGTALNIALTARELGLPIMGAVNGLLYTVGGKVGMSALTMRHLIKQQGHAFTIIEEEDTHAVVYGKRIDTKEEMTIKYTIDMAKRAGYVKPDSNYEKFPADMMLARATAKLARRLFEDIIASCPYTTEELHDIEKTKDADPTITDAKIVTPEDNKLTQEIAKAGEGTTEAEVKKRVTAATKKEEEPTAAEKRAATRAKKLAEKEAADKKTAEDKWDKDQAVKKAQGVEDKRLEAEIKEAADKEGEVVDAEVVEFSPRDDLQVKVDNKSEADDRFDKAITTKEVDNALEYASSNNGEDVDEMVERILDDETFSSFWTWLSNYIFDQRGSK